jgi:hypothetical protein
MRRAYHHPALAALLISLAVLCCAPQVQAHDGYRFGCGGAAQRCHGCRDAWGGPMYDYRTHFDYPWDPPLRRPPAHSAGYVVDLGPLGDPLGVPPWEALPSPAPRELLPLPGTLEDVPEPPQELEPSLLPDDELLRGQTRRPTRLRLLR